MTFQVLNIRIPAFSVEMSNTTVTSGEESQLFTNFLLLNSPDSRYYPCIRGN